MKNIVSPGITSSENMMTTGQGMMNDYMNCWHLHQAPTDAETGNNRVANSKYCYTFIPKWTDFRKVICRWQETFQDTMLPVDKIEPIYENLYV